MMDEVLKKFGLKYDDLNPSERETLHGWMENVSTGQLTLEKVREYIVSMRDSVEDELTKTDISSKQDMFLKARLKNYKMLEAFIASPEKAKQYIEKALSNIVAGRK